MPPRLSDANRRDVKEELRAIMIETARARETITYKDLTLRLQTATLHYHAGALNTLLTEIGREEVEAGRGVLPAVVVTQATGMPGGGYFSGAAWMHPDAETLEAMWRDDLNALYDYWAQEA